MTASIRPATVDDVAGIHAVRLASWRAAYADLMPAAAFDAFDAATATARWRTRLLDGSMRALVADVEATVVAFCSFGAGRDADPAAGGEIYGLYAHPEHWSTGVGRELLTASVAAIGARPITLWVLRDNARARRFYERAGWRPDGAEQAAELPGDVVLPEMRYRLS